MGRKKDSDGFEDAESPELEDDVPEPERTRQMKLPTGGFARPSRDPIAIEKPVEMTSHEPIDSSAHKVRDYYPRRSAEPVVEETTQPAGIFGIIGGAIALLFLFSIGFAGIRWFLGVPIVPRQISEAIHGAPPPPVVPAGPAKVAIQTDIVGYEVHVNGVKQTTFNHQFEITPGAPVEVVVSRVGYNDFKATVIPEAGKTVVIQPTLSQAKPNGFLTYETVPEAKLTLYADGKVVAELRTPVTGHQIPVGEYRAVLENVYMGYRSEETIQIEEWKTLSIRKQLPNSRVSNVPVSSVTPIPAR